MGSATNFIVSAVFTGKAPVDPWGISGFKTPNDLRSAERTRHRVGATVEFKSTSARSYRRREKFVTNP